MNRYLLAALTCSFVSTAFAAGTTINNSGTGGVGVGGAGGTSTATIASGAVKNSNTLSGSGNSTIASGAVRANSNSTANNDGSNNRLTATANGNGNGSNNTTVTYQSRSAVSAAYAPGLTSGVDTCMGSVSAGAQTQVLGVTFGGTKIDKNCVTIKRTHLIAEFSVTAGCDYMLKNVPGAAQAFKQAGVTCASVVPRSVKKKLAIATSDVAAMQVENQRLVDNYNAMRALIIGIQALPEKHVYSVVKHIPVPPSATAYSFTR